MKLTNKEIINYAQEFLNEDKTNKDITSKYFIDKTQRARAEFLSEEKIVLSGIDLVLKIFKLKCKNFKILKKNKDGKKINKNGKILVIEANAKDILSIERTTLNILQHLSGISTLTNEFCKRIKTSKAINSPLLKSLIENGKLS